MKFKIKINVMPLDLLLDPKGKATESALQELNFRHANNVRIGKRIQLELIADNEDNAYKTAKEMANQLLANRVMESYEIEVEAITE